LTAHYRHLTIDDRIQIQTLHDRGKSKAEISRSIGVHRSTIFREFTRGSFQPERDHANLCPYLRNRLDTRGPRNRLYLGHQAPLQAQTRGARSHQPHRMRQGRLVAWVIKRWTNEWTPQEISGRLGLEFGDYVGGDAQMRVSTELLYAWIYDSAQRLKRAPAILAPRGEETPPPGGPAVSF
jgi:IS30 family transposase